MTTTVDTDLQRHVLGHTAAIVCAYVSKNPLPASGVPDLIAATHAAVTQIAGQAGPAATVEPDAPLVPAVPIKKSIADDYLICLEDGKKFKSLKRHLQTQYNLSPEQYRRKWGLLESYPMVAPNYARARSDLARQMGLGQQRRKQLTPPTSAPAPKKARAA